MKGEGEKKILYYSYSFSPSCLLLSLLFLAAIQRHQTDARDEDDGTGVSRPTD